MQIISHLLWEDCLAIKMYLFQSVCFFISIFPVPTNISKQINGYEIAIVKSIPSSKCEFFLSVFVSSHPKHPQGKHSWTETSQDWETVQKTSSFHSWQEKCSEKMCKRSSHPLKYYLSFDTFTIATGINAQAWQNIQLKTHVIRIKKKKARSSNC